MSLYRVTADNLEVACRTTFAAESVRERKDLQRLLTVRDAISSTLLVHVCFQETSP